MSSPKTIVGSKLSPSNQLSSSSLNNYSSPGSSTIGAAGRRSSTEQGRTNAGGAVSPASQVKASLKKLSVSDSAADKSPSSTSPLARPRVSSVGGPSGKVNSAISATSNSTVTSVRRVPAANNMSSPPARTAVTKAPVQSPTAGGMKMRPASGNGVSTLSSIGPSAMNALANPYSTTLSSASTSSQPAPNSPIASASPNARRFKPAGTPTSGGTTQPAASSPIHSISPAGAQALRKSYEQPAVALAPAPSGGASSYRATHPNAHAPVNTHSHPPPNHMADHNVSGTGIFSPVYNRTASQEQLRLEEEKKAAAAKHEEERYRQAAQAQAYAQQQQQAQQAALAAQQQQHTVSYTPPQVEEDEFDPFLFIRNLPPLSPAMRNRRSPLPKKSLKAPPITLALDLDETLVHCSVQPIERAELTFKVAFNGMDYEVYVRTRPHMKEFLETVSQWFEIIIFTASQKVYADKLLNILDPQGTLIKYRVFRDSCVCVDGNYLKDLHILGRDLPSVAIVDNSVQAFGFQLDNGIPIESWFDDDNDRELLNLIPFLRQLKDVKDVRPLIRDTFRLSEFVASL